MCTHILSGAKPVRSGLTLSNHFKLSTVNEYMYFKWELNQFEVVRHFRTTMTYTAV